jgi:hypothetical protein
VVWQGRRATAAPMPIKRRYWKLSAMPRFDGLVAEATDITSYCRKSSLIPPTAPTRWAVMLARHAICSLLRVPVRVWGEVAASEAGRHFPLVETSGAYATGVEGVPRETAVAEPPVFRVRRPVALRTANAGTARAAVRSVLGAYAATGLDLMFHGVMHVLILAPSQCSLGSDRSRLRAQSPRGRFRFVVSGRR